MADRLMKVNAFTTLDLADVTVRGHDFEQEGFAVVNAKSAREDPDHVELQVEADNMQETELPAHVEELELSPEQARTLADDLRKHAEKVEAASADDADAAESADGEAD